MTAYGGHQPQSSYLAGGVSGPLISRGSYFGYSMDRYLALVGSIPPLSTIDNSRLVLRTIGVIDIIHSFPYVLFAWLGIIDRLRLWYTRCRRFPASPMPLLLGQLTSHDFYWRFTREVYGIAPCLFRIVMWPICLSGDYLFKMIEPNALQVNKVSSHTD